MTEQRAVQQNEQATNKEVFGSTIVFLAVFRYNEDESKHSGLKVNEIDAFNS